MKRIFIYVFFSLIVFFQVSFSQEYFTDYNNGEPIPSPDETSYIPLQIIVKMSLRDLDHRTVPRNLFKKYRSEIKEIIFHTPTGYHILNLFPESDLKKLLLALSEDPLIARASPNYFGHIVGVEPNDHFFHFQYALLNDGQIFFPELEYRGKRDCDIKAIDGWDWSTGNEDMVIAVVDTGVAIHHEDLIHKCIAGYNFIEDSFDVQDDNGHGTLVASIAASETNNSIGGAGVCWNAKIMPIKTFDSTGLGDYLSIAAGIRFAVDRGAKVINLSFGGKNDSFILEDACHYAYEKGCVLVAATGNDGSGVLYPASYDNYCLAVGASDADDLIASWSNYGPEVDVVAPGFFVFGAIFSPMEPDNLALYGWGSGTSFAAPHVSGAAALVLSYKPFLSNSQVMDLIRYTADDVNKYLYSGLDEYMGYGRINLKTLLGPFPLD